MSSPNASSSRPTGFAIIGCGLIGRKRAEALRKIPGVALRTTCDLDAARAANLAQPVPVCTASTDYAAVLADPAVDAVIVATLNAALAPISFAVVQAGKHVLVEKPGALNAAQLRTIQAAAANTGARRRIGYNPRLHPAPPKAPAPL